MGQTTYNSGFIISTASGSAEQYGVTQAPFGLTSIIRGACVARGSFAGNIPYERPDCETTAGGGGDIPESITARENLATLVDKLNDEGSTYERLLTMGFHADSHGYDALTMVGVTSETKQDQVRNTALLQQFCSTFDGVTDKAYTLAS